MNNTTKRNPRRRATGAGAFGRSQFNPKQQHSIPTRPASQQFCDHIAAEVLKAGGEVHRTPDGEGGFSQLSIINPQAIRPANREGRN